MFWVQISREAFKSGSNGVLRRYKYALKLIINIFEYSHLNFWTRPGGDLFMFFFFSEIFAEF